MDFDPVPVYERVRCPVLAVWGEADPWIPVDASEAALRSAIRDRLTALRLPATGHGSGRDRKEVREGSPSASPASPGDEGRPLVAAVSAALRRCLGRT